MSGANVGNLLAAQQMPDGPLVLGMTLSVIPRERSERWESSRSTADARRTFGPGHDTFGR